jgi:hypothetical protein
LIIGAFLPIIPLVRVCPYTRSATALVIVLATSCAGAASAGAVSVAGVTVPVKTPQVPTVQVPSVPAAPAPVGSAVDTVNGVAGTVTNTVNGTTGSAPEPGKTIDNATQGTPVGRSSGGGGSSTGAPKTNPATSTPVTGSGSGPVAPSAGSGSGQTRRRTANTRSGGTGGKPARARRTRPGVPTAPALTRLAARTGAGGTAAKKKDDGSNPVATVIRQIERIIPGPIKILIGVLALLALGFGVRSRFAVGRARRLERQREELLGDVGLLQRALLPDVPNDLKGIDVSVAYRPAEGPAAGGDFYDVFELEGGRTAIIVGDVCGHGRAALAVTALMRYTLRAYAAAGFEPRVALQVAGRALDGDPEGALTTVVLAVYDPSAGTLTYACAGHEPPIVLGPGAYEPVTAFSSPPLGGFMATGQRQTTIALPPGSSACFFTDGLVEARLGNDMIGRGRLSQLLSELAPDAGAQLLLDRVAASADRAPDDMAACLVRAHGGAASAPAERVEELEVTSGELDGDRVLAFLLACGVAEPTAAEALRAARAKAAEFAGAVLCVHAEGTRRRVEVSPRETASLPVPSLDDARQRAALEVPAA